MTAFAAQNPPVTVVHIALMTDDGQDSAPLPAATHKSNMQAIIAGVQASRPGARIVLGWSPWVNSGVGVLTDSINDNPRMAAYQGADMALVNGSSVLLGETDPFWYFQANLQYADSGINPSLAGSAALGQMQTYGLWRALYATLIPGMKRRFQ